jgi:hypothetical protein
MPLTNALSVPVVVQPEVAARVSELGHEVPFDQLLQQVEKLTAGLQEIQVELVPDYDEGGEPGIYILGVVDPTVGTDDAARREWGEWKIASFPPDVWRHYTLWTTLGVRHAG